MEFPNETKRILAYYQFPTNNVFPNVFSSSDDTSYLIRDDFSMDNSVAEQGLITFTDVAEGCPLEFLSKEKPFEISQENQILHIRSSYDSFEIRQKPCQWRFSAPDGFGFKIVVQRLNISTTTSFRIENDTQIIANERSVKTYFPYYNSDNFIQITLSKGDSNFNTDLEFQAYISLVKNSQEKTNVSCKVLFQNNTIIWSNINETKGYENNLHCFYELILPPNAVVIVSVSGYLEDKIDYIKYWELQSNYSKIIEIPKYPNDLDFVIDNFKDNFDKHYIFEFVSDGNVQVVGFKVIFEFIDCKRNQKVANCGTFENRLLEYPSSLNEYYYCGNLRCNITIGECPAPLTYVEFSTNTHVSNNDIFKIISNNLTIYEIIDWDHDTKVTYLNSTAENILQVTTFHSSNFNTFYFSVSNFYAPSESKVTFSETNITTIIDTGLTRFTFVETKLNNQSFLIHSPNPELMGLYTDTSLITPIKYCFFGDHPNTCIIKKKSFVVYSNPEHLSTFLTIRLTEGTSNCVFPETTYYTNKLTSSQIAALSKPFGSCLITVMVDYQSYYYSTNFWTNSEKENVKIFAGIDQTKLILEFNSKTQKLWNRIPFNSAIYTILIPPSAAVFITLTKQTNTSERIETNQYKALMTSPDYGCTKRQFVTSFAAIHIFYIFDYPVKFTVLDMLQGDSVSFLVNHQKISVNKTGEYLIAQNQTVSFYYSPYSLTPKSGVFLLIETY